MAFLQLIDLKTYFPVRTGVLGRASGDWVKAVDGVNLSIEKGEILGLVGESGCGKSSLSRTVMQLVPASSGEVLLEGEDLCQLAKSEVRRRRLDFQMIFQDPYASLNPRMTVYSTLAEAIRQRHPSCRGAQLETRITELMKRCGLDPRFMKKYPHEFSGGQRQRIAIARALAPEPKLVIADEPVSALDVSIQSQILNLLLKLRDELGLTMIFITHDLSVVRYLADNIAVMNKGKIVEYGEAEAIFNSPQQPYTQKLLSAIPRLSCADSV
ncbi:ATP-binding cassette domain-containing protein [Persicirhabdus sediminis]|uniref:ABC transporter ATP-binding protein n=1 Tax=Persicirhabdus sediminis TaxID=454144 RepID=A0A8J7MBK8_9BACT|nr:ATP-binding cassette domain-containing protein [Persicirhabdus sediminis]MBK1790442.1 ABC transporter ATP-binding protein [Persicirhabdus sediminis]